MARGPTGRAARAAPYPWTHRSAAFPAARAGEEREAAPGRGVSFKAMEFDERRDGEIVVLVPRGVMDFERLPAFMARVEALLKGGVRFFVVDLGQVELLPSTAVGFLVRAAQQAKAAGGRVVLSSVRRRTRATLATMGVLELFPVCEDVEAATRMHQRS